MKIILIVFDHFPWTMVPKKRWLTMKVKLRRRREIFEGPSKF